MISAAQKTSEPDPSEGTEPDPSSTQVFDELHAIDPRKGLPDVTGTRSDVLRDSHKWLVSQPEYTAFDNPNWNDDDPPIVWVTGDPGSGKSTLLAMVVNDVMARARKSGGGGRTFHQPDLKVHLDELRSSTGRRHFDHPNDFLTLSGLLHTFGEAPRATQQDFLRLVLRSTQWARSFRWLISSTSRTIWPEESPCIRHIDLNADTENASIRFEKHVVDRVSKLAQDIGYDKKLQGKILALMAQRTGSNYVEVEILCKRLMAAEAWHADKIIEGAPNNLEKLLEKMHGEISKSSLWRIAKRCYGFLDVHDDGTVYFSHHSARDYARKAAVQRYSGAEHLHSLIAERCLDVLTNFLVGQESGGNVSAIEKKSPGEMSLVSVRYSSLWWIQHACEMESLPSDGQTSGLILSFLKQHATQWIDILDDIDQLRAASWSLRNLAAAAKVEFSLDGRLLISASDDRTVRVWDVETGTTQRVFRGHSDWVMAVGSSSKGLVASGSDDCHVRIWDLFTGQPIMDRYVERRVLSVRFSSDSSKLMVLTSGRTVHLWNTNTFDGSTHSLPGAVEAALSPTGSSFAWANDESITFQDVARDPPAKQRFEVGASYLEYCFDRSRLASCKEDVVRIWDTETFTQVCTLTSSANILCLAFSEDGTTLSTAQKDEICVWDLPTETITARVPARGTICTALSPNGQRLGAGSTSGDVIMWDSHQSTGSELTQQCPEVDQRYITALGISLDGKRVAAAQSQSIRIWDADSGLPVPLEANMEHSSTICHLAFSLDGKKLVSSSYDGTAGVWSVESGSLLARLTGHHDWVRQSTFSPNGRYVATASDDAMVRIWDLEGKPPSRENAGLSHYKKLEGHTEYVRCVSWAENGRTLASGGDDLSVRIWDCESWTLKYELGGVGIRDAFQHVAFFPDSRRVMGSSASHVVVWCAETGHTLCEPVETEHAYRGLRFDERSSDYVVTDLGARLVPTLNSATSTPEQARYPAWAPYGLQIVHIKDQGNDEDSSTSSEDQSSDGDTDNSWWITWNGRRVIYLPREYKPTASVVSGYTVAIGCKAGQVLIFGFSPDVPPPESAGKRHPKLLA
ncbi:hypothetical protein OQA88_7739 [Cercophora sp. LCS_1]